MFRIIMLCLILSACAPVKRQNSLTITDQVGRVTGYIEADGTITDQVGRVKGYIQ